jgi:hypothetical protein
LLSEWIRDWLLSKRMHDWLLRKQMCDWLLREWMRDWLLREWMLSKGMCDWLLRARCLLYGRVIWDWCKARCLVERDSRNCICQFLQLNQPSQVDI